VPQCPIAGDANAKTNCMMHACIIQQPTGMEHGINEEVYSTPVVLHRTVSDLETLPNWTVNDGNHRQRSSRSWRLNDNDAAKVLGTRKLLEPIRNGNDFVFNAFLNFEPVER